jgi:3'-phosphoadenosine 5'-phosphosulfate sulfotransferase (PAPS reductase)/FAD synthetase
MDNSKKASENFNHRLNGDPWLQGINFLLSMNLEGLRTRCPSCKRLGTPVTKWVKGEPVKPLYVFHKNGRNGPNACLLSTTEAEQVRPKITLQRQDIRTLLQNTEPFVLFSGGKDSLCTLDYIKKIASNIRKEVTAIHVDTTAGFPEVTKYVKKVCKKMEVHLEIVGPKTDYFSLAKKWGIPSANSRWCCKTLKIQPITKFLKSITGPKIVFDGIRGAESATRAKYLPVWFHPSFNCLSVSPIFNWSNEDIHSYIKEKALPKSPAFKLGTSGECWCGAYKKRSDFEDLYRVHPEIYNELIKVEESNKYGFTFVYEKGTKITLKELKKEIHRKKRSKNNGQVQ